MNRSTYLKSCERIVEIVILIIAGFLSFSIMKTCILFAVFRFLYSILALMLVRKWMPDFFPWWKLGNVRIGFRNYLISLSLTFNFFVERFSKDGLNLIISSTLGLSVLPIFTTIKTLINFATQGTNVIMGPLQPELVRFHALQQWMKIVESMKTNWLLSNLILNIPFILAIFFIGDLYHIWTDHKIVFDFELFAYLTISVLIFNYGNSYITYLKGINHIKGLLVTTTCRAILLMFLSVFLLKHLGLVGIGIAILITEIATSITIPFLFVQNELRKSGYTISFIDRLFPLISISIVALIYILKIVNMPIIASSIMGILFILVISIIQWKYINIEVKTRIIKLVSRFRKLISIG